MFTKTKELTKKKGKIMYYVITGCIGFILGALTVYLWMSYLFIKKQQQKKIVRFVRGMKNLVRSGKKETVEKSIEIFSRKCFGFEAEVFFSLKTREYSVIAECINRYDGQWRSYDGSGILPQPVGKPISEEMLFTQICEQFRKIIYS